MKSEPLPGLRPTNPSRGIRRAEYPYAIAIGAMIISDEPEPEPDGDPWQDGVVGDTPTSD